MNHVVNEVYSNQLLNLACYSNFACPYKSDITQQLLTPQTQLQATLTVMHMLAPHGLPKSRRFIVELGDAFV